MAVVFKTLSATLAANVNELTFTDAIINSNSVIEVYYNSNDVYTVETWQDGTTIGIVTSDHNFPVGVKVTINNVISFEPYDDSGIVQDISDIESDISGLSTRVGNAENDIDGLENYVSSLSSNKQDKLTAGSGITIENNVISASSSTYSETVLVTNTNFNSASGTANISKTYLLSDSLENYDAVVVYAYMYNIIAGNLNNRAGLVSMVIFKNDFYDTSYAGGQPTSSGFQFNGTTNTARRALDFYFSDSTHLQTTAIRTEDYVEPILLKVVGLKF